jgi:hypothetical protein
MLLGNKAVDIKGVERGTAGQKEQTVNIHAFVPTPLLLRKIMVNDVITGD